MKVLRDEVVGLAALIIGLVALLLLMPGLFSPGGPALLRVLLGWGAVPAVVGLVVGGIGLIFAPKMGWQVRWEGVAGSELLFVALLALSHLGTKEPLAAALGGQGGGVVGWAVAQFLSLWLPGPLARVALGVVVVGAAWLIWQALPAAWTAPARLAWKGALRSLEQGWAIVLPRVPIWADAASQGLLNVLRNLRPELPGTSPGRGASQPRAPAAPTPARARPSPKKAAPPVSKEPAATSRGARREAAQPRQQPRPVAPPSPPAGPLARRGGLPPLDLLKPDEGHPNSNADVRQRAQILKQTLAEFGIPVEVVSIKEGPVVTQFGLEPGEIVRELRNGEIRRRRVSVASILRLSNDLALALAAPSIRIEAPVPGRPYVGVEVPNTTKTLVSLRSILTSREFGRMRSPLAAALGRDVSGDPVVIDLASLPHLLIAGATGSGKSVCINAIICSLLMNNGPETVRFIMVDPKMVELPAYNGIPHLLGPVITDVTQVRSALAWLTLQMDDRYRLFSDNGVRNIVEFNRKAAKARLLEPLPYIILVIDELADLMMTAADEVERQICRLAQMARATGIHLVLATQRPSVDVITGLIKANFPARIAFAVTSQVDSRVILDTPGAEKLLGRGDMLYMAPDAARLARIQGCFVSDQEIDAIVEFWRAARDTSQVEQAAPWAGLLDEMEGQDELLEQALELLEGKSHVSTSLLQRQLRIGFPRAARLMEQLEEMGVVGPDEGGGRSRAVLLSQADQTP